MWWRRIKKIILSLLALIVILLATLVAIVETNTGSRWVINTAAAYLGIDLGEVRGDLRHGLDIGWLEYNTAAQTIRADNISFRWNAPALLYTVVSFDSFSVDALKIQIAPAADQPQTQEAFNNWPNLGLPLRIELKKFQLGNIQFQQGDYQDQWQEVSGSLSLGAFYLRYAPLHVKHENYQLLLRGSSEAKFPYLTRARLQWQFNADTQYAGQTSLQGDLRKFVSKTQFDSPFKGDALLVFPLVDSQNYLQTSPDLDLQFSVERQDFPQAWWMQDQPLPQVEFTLTATGNWNAYKAELVGQWAQSGLPEVNLSLKAQGDWQKVTSGELQLQEQRAQVDTANPVSNLQAQGEFHWLPQLKWDISAHSDFFNAALIAEAWPTRLKASLHTQGEKTETGWLWKLNEMDFNGQVRDLAFSLKGNLQQDENRWQSEKVELIWGANRFTADGHLSKVDTASSRINWDLQAPLLGQIDNQFSGGISSRGYVSGSLDAPAISADTKASDISWQNISLKELTLVLKPTAVNNNQSQPAADSESNSHRGLHLDQQYQLQFVANQLQLFDQNFKSIQVSGNGSLFEHQLVATVRHTPLGKVDFDVTGKFDEQNWTGIFQKLIIKVKSVPKWWLSTSRPVRISREDIEVEPLCFTTRSNQTAIINSQTQAAEDAIANRPFYTSALASSVKYDWFPTAKPNQNPIKILPAPELCVDFRWQPEKGMQLDADLHAVPLRQFLALFKPEVFFAGVMNGYLRFHASPESPAQAVAFIETRDAELRYQYEGGVTEVYPWTSALLTAELKNSQLSADFRTEWAGYGNLKTNVQLALDKKDIRQALFEAAFHNLQPFETLLPGVDDVKGQFAASVKASGSFEDPQIAGYIRLDDVSAKIPKLGLSLTKASSSVTANDMNQLNLMASATSDKGSLSLQGVFFNPLQDNWQFIADLNGKDFQILNLTNMKANINPSIKMDATPQLIKLTGEAEVPYMRANIKTIPQSAVMVSDDVVLVNEKETPAKNNSIPIYANLRLRLGNDVEFKGFGLESKLSGDLQLNKEAQRPWMTNGFVGVREGSYHAYGQSLTIERGQLIFQGDYENPGLDIRASRVIADDENTKVGLEISGTLKRPRAKVYSEARTAYSDSDAMMMLLTGKPLSEASKADASVLMAALGGLGVERSQSITQDVAQFFGVDEVSIKADKGLDQSQLWVGKYLTPKILVRYVVGLFDQAFSFAVIYRLTDRVRIEAESGETQSLDMIYKIER